MEFTLLIFKVLSNKFSYGNLSSHNPQHNVNRRLCFEPAFVQRTFVPSGRFQLSRAATACSKLTQFIVNLFAAKSSTARLGSVRWPIPRFVIVPLAPSLMLLPPRSELPPKSA